jgi:anti-sigma B factor antagonist
VKLQIHFEPRVAVIEVSGKVLGGTDAAVFHGTIFEHLHRGGRNFVVDLGGVDRMNSSGLGMLIAAHTAIKKAGGRLAVTNITNLESLLSMTRIIRVLENFESVDLAVRRLQNGLPTIPPQRPS